MVGQHCIPGVMAGSDADFAQEVEQLIASKQRETPRGPPPPLTARTSFASASPGAIMAPDAAALVYSARRRSTSA